MFFRLTRYRLKTEWLRFLLGIIFAVTLVFWYGTASIPAERLHSFNSYVAYYQRMTQQEAHSKGLQEPEPPAKSDLRAGYEMLLQNSRGFIYSRLVMSVNDPVPILVTNALAVLLLTSLYAIKRLGAPIAAGCSRGCTFFSMTGGYFLSVLLVWVISSDIMLKRYCVEFSTDEQDFFKVIQLTWFCAFLWKSTIAYLAAMLLRRPLPAFFVAFIVSMILMYYPEPNILPSWIIGSTMQVNSLDPGIDLQPMLRTDTVAIALFVLSIIVGWLSFRKRGLE